MSTILREIRQGQTPNLRQNGHQKTTSCTTLAGVDVPRGIAAHLRRGGLCLRAGEGGAQEEGYEDRGACREEVRG